MKPKTPKIKIRISPEKEFGYVFCGVFLLLAFLPLLKGHPVRLWALGISVLFFVMSCISPAILKYPSQAWLKFGALLHRLINPIVLGIIYFGVVWPIGAIMRKKKSGSLRIDFDSSVKSYWNRREPAGPDPKTMRQQF